ncbi:unnamed protein product [Soboliphyme baturini]|uniref:EF-hand domain-containing protein n=1 Tax=Soboliphyme baturini TaxID=241478 RepID=A0A183J4I9_9BILA|nr:unnamed protein product [Soboliphyme baturini]VDP34672.1 unnamed protein product [Soboliphyme baturini]
MEADVEHERKLTMNEVKQKMNVMGNQQVPNEAMENMA